MLKLNQDILRLVVSYLSMEDARSLSATSRYLHPEARARALAKVRIKTPKTFDAACKFYLAEHSDRIHHLRTLDVQLDDSYITRHASRKLADLLDHACNLRTFMLDCAEQWILAQPRIEAVLQRLQAIHAMGLLLAGWRALRTIRGMQGKLRNIELMSLVFPLTTEENEPHASSAAMLEALAPHASARSIALVVQDQATSPPDVQLQQVLELRLGNASAAAPSLDVLAHVFPALRILFLDGPSMTIDKPADNIECWECLDYVSGTFPALRAWAPKCRVHHLEIRDAEWEGRILAKNERVSDVSRVINGTSPVALTIYRFMAAMYFGLTYADWVGFLYNMPRLRVLAVDLSTGPSWSKTWIACTTGALIGFKVICIMLSVDERVKMPPAILASIPSLKFVALNFGGGPLPTFSAHSGGFNPYPALSWWRVVCDHGERQLQAMSADLGSRIAAYLYSPNYNHEAPIDESMFLPKMLEEYKPGRVTVAQAL